MKSCILIATFNNEATLERTVRVNMNIVALDGRPVNSCLFPAQEIDGRVLITANG